MEEFEGDGPEGFWDDLKGGIGWEVPEEMVNGEPFAASAVGVQGFGGGGSGALDVVEEAAVDQLLGDDGLVAEFRWEVTLGEAGELELVGAEAGEFSEVVVAGVGAGEGEAGVGLDGEVEFGGEFEMNELAGSKVTEEKIEFADGGVDVGLDLQVLGEEIVAGGVGEEEAKGVLVEVPEFLVEVEVGSGVGEGEMVPGEGGGFGEVADEEGGVDETMEERERDGHGGLFSGAGDGKGMVRW